MKQGTVKFSKEFVTPIGLKEWVGIELEYDMNTECPREVLTNAKTIIEQWHNSNNSTASQFAPPTEIPVINKAEERLGILIENATTIKELLNYKNDLTTPYLADLFSSKMAILK